MLSVDRASPGVCPEPTEPVGHLNGAKSWDCHFPLHSVTAETYRKSQLHKDLQLGPGGKCPQHPTSVPEVFYF